MIRPQTREPVHEPKPSNWDDHVEDLEKRGRFKRMYRMSREAFEKLAGLLAPLLWVSQHHARE